MNNRLQLQLTIFALLTFFSAYSQAPQEMNYQSVVRDASGNLLKNTTVGVKFVIHNGTDTGTIVYHEETSAVTNQFGLITLPIGANGNLAIVNWSAGAKYLQ